MAERAVVATGKDKNGNILTLCNSSASWSPRWQHDAIRDIKSGLHQYYVLKGEKKAYIQVVPGPSGEYLRTNWDGTTRNNLDDLPDC